MQYPIRKSNREERAQPCNGLAILSGFGYNGLNRSSGSSFDLWVNSGAEELRDRGELNILEQRSVPGFQKYRAFAENHVLRIDVMLELLEVRLIEISPYTEI